MTPRVLVLSTRRIKLSLKEKGEDWVKNISFCRQYLELSFGKVTSEVPIRHLTGNVE